MLHKVCDVHHVDVNHDVVEGAEDGAADDGDAVGSSVGEVVGADAGLAEGHAGDSVGLRVSSSIVGDSVGAEEGARDGLVEEGSLVGLVDGVVEVAEDGDHVGESVMQGLEAPVCVLTQTVGGDNRFCEHSKAKHSSQKAVLPVPPMASSMSSSN